MLTVINGQNLNPNLLPYLPHPKSHSHPHPHTHTSTQAPANRHTYQVPAPPLQHLPSIPRLSIPLSLPLPPLAPPNPSPTHLNFNPPTTHLQPQPLSLPHPPHPNQKSFHIKRSTPTTSTSQHIIGRLGTTKHDFKSRDVSSKSKPKSEDVAIIPTIPFHNAKDNDTLNTSDNRCVNDVDNNTNTQIDMRNSAIYITNKHSSTSNILIHGKTRTDESESDNYNDNNINFSNHSSNDNINSMSSKAVSSSNNPITSVSTKCRNPQQNIYNIDINNNSNNSNSSNNSYDISTESNAIPSRARTTISTIMKGTFQSPTFRSMSSMISVSRLSDTRTTFLPKQNIREVHDVTPKMTTTSSNGPGQPVQSHHLERSNTVVTHENSERNEDVDKMEDVETAESCDINVTTLDCDIHVTTLEGRIKTEKDNISDRKSLSSSERTNVRKSGEKVDLICLKKVKIDQNDDVTRLVFKDVIKENVIVRANKLRHSIASILNMNHVGCSHGDSGDDVVEEYNATIGRHLGDRYGERLGDFQDVNSEVVSDQERQLSSCQGSLPVSRCSSVEYFNGNDNDGNDDDDDFISVENSDDEIDVYHTKVGNVNDLSGVSPTVKQSRSVSRDDSMKGDIDEDSCGQKPIIDNAKQNTTLKHSTVASLRGGTTSHLKRIEDLIVKNDQEHFIKDEFFSAKTQILESSQFEDQFGCDNNEPVVPGGEKYETKLSPIFSKDNNNPTPGECLTSHELLSAQRHCEPYTMVSHLHPHLAGHWTHSNHPHCPSLSLHAQVQQQQQLQQQQLPHLPDMCHYPHQHSYHPSQQHHPLHQHQYNPQHQQQQQQQQQQLQHHHFYQPQDDSNKSAFKPIVKSWFSKLPHFSPYPQFSLAVPADHPSTIFSPKENPISIHDPHPNDTLSKSSCITIDQSPSSILSPSLQNQPHIDAISLLRDHTIGFQTSDPLTNGQLPGLVSSSKHSPNTISSWLSWVRHRYGNQAPRNLTLPNVTPTKKTQIAPRYHCESCNKTYSTFGGLSKHRQFHCLQHVKKDFGCKFCSKSYSSLGALKMHLRTHTLPCKCHVCGKAFSRPWLLQGHVRTHTGEKPFRCGQCDRAFADRSNLRAHLQTHAEIKKYACVRCGKTFSRMSLLSKHAEGSCPANVMTI